MKNSNFWSQVIIWEPKHKNSRRGQNVVNSPKYWNKANISNPNTDFKQTTCPTQVQYRNIKHKTKSLLYRCLQLLDVLRNPLEAIPVAHFANDAAHEHLEWTHARLREVHLPLARGDTAQTHVVTQLIF